MADGPDAGLRLLDALADDLDRYHLYHAARADLLRRSGDETHAAASYARALDLVTSPAERRFLEGRLASIHD
jgi:RNA polymerase sigma-70 factor, ECF subfamily